MGWRTSRYGPDRTSSWVKSTEASIRRCRPRARAAVQESAQASAKRETDSARRHHPKNKPKKVPATTANKTRTPALRPSVRACAREERVLEDPRRPGGLPHQTIQSAPKHLFSFGRCRSSRAGLKSIGDRKKDG